MREVFITQIHEADNNNYASDDLPECPICGARPFISKDIVDGFYYGWSVGCPNYCENDGIHNNPTEHLTKHLLNNKEECVDWWVNRCKRKV